MPDPNRYKRATRSDAIAVLLDALDAYGVDAKSAQDIAEDYVDGNFYPEDFEAGEVEFDDDDVARDLASSHFEDLRDIAADAAYGLWKEG